MTKRAKFIRMFVGEVVDLAENSLYIRTNARKAVLNSSADWKVHLEAEAFLETKIRNMEACLAEIVENNPEQAEALMKDLNIEWSTPKSENPPTTPPE